LAATIRQYDDKQEAIKQWTEDPCGISRVKDLEPGTKEFYERVDRSRYDEYAPWMKSTLNFSSYPSQKVLEIGFGMDTDLFQFACAGSDVSGIYLSPIHLDIARKRFLLYEKNADLRLADAEDMPFDNETFDVVYSFGTLHHTPNANKAIGEIHRVLKPGGLAIFGVYHKYSAFFLLCVFGPYLWRLRFLRESYRRTLSRIEYREHSDVCPLVGVYSRARLGRASQEFNDVVIECVHLWRAHFESFKYLLENTTIPKLEKRLDRYSLAKCKK
jgi:SAM-dependent methyltransferase